MSYQFKSLVERPAVVKHEPDGPETAAAFELGRTGSPATDAERVQFEAWMAGHCWACAAWDGASYTDQITRMLWAAWRDRAALAARPIDMVLHCPACGMQHVDAPDWRPVASQTEFAPLKWDNPPHRSHLCHHCGHIWRPADVATNGVEAVKTVGKNDSPARVKSPQLPTKSTSHKGILE